MRESVNRGTWIDPEPREKTVGRLDMTSRLDLVMRRERGVE